MSPLYVVIRHESVYERIQEVTTPEAVIGRGEHCAIWLPDLLVSREHAVIVHVDSQLTIRDLDSRNGTQVNGRPVGAKEILFDGAEIQIRPYCLAVCFGFGNALRQTISTDASTHSDLVSSDQFEMQLLRLTPAQRRVYDLLLRGMIEKEVAANLGISINTVHDHAKAIYKALSVSTRGELISRGKNQQGRAH